MNIIYQKNSISYNGKNLPQDKVAVIHPGRDMSNFPSRVILGNIGLPGDVAIYLDGKKTIAQSKILDGVVVYERILREPYNIEFEMVLRTKQGNDYIFPQYYIEQIWENLWLLDGVIKIENTYLNGLGIMEMVIETISPTTVRGSKNLPLRIRGFENVTGQSLIIETIK